MTQREDKNSRDLLAGMKETTEGFDVSEKQGGFPSLCCAPQRQKIALNFRLFLAK